MLISHASILNFLDAILLLVAFYVLLRFVSPNLVLFLGLEAVDVTMMHFKCI